jgi:hypothetical protein
MEQDSNSTLTSMKKLLDNSLVKDIVEVTLGILLMIEWQVIWIEIIYLHYLYETVSP